MAIKLTMVGAKGRMGQTILKLAHADKSFEVVGESDHGDDLAKAVAKAQVVVDFSHRSATKEIIQQVVAVKAAYVCGTTGHTEAEKNLIQQASHQVPIIHSPNFSLVVNLLFYLTSQAARALSKGMLLAK